MERGEQTVRVWAGLDLLQAQLMRQILLDNDIECFGDRDPGVIPAGEFGEMALWVRKQDEQRARALLEQAEEEMSAALDAENNPPPADS